MARIYNLTLLCGCMLSSDGGGGLIPCAGGMTSAYDDGNHTIEEIEAHEKAWREFQSSGEQKRFNEEVERNNR